MFEIDAETLKTMGAEITTREIRQQPDLWEDTLKIYDDNAEAIQEDAIVKVKGKFEANDRGNQIMAFEVEVIELNEADARPSHLELKVASSDFDQSKSLRLNRILKSYPGRDGVVLLVQQSDGRKFRAELPVSVDSRSPVMRSEIQDLFGSQVWRAS